MNIPRIEMLAALKGINFEGNIPKEKCLHSLGWDLNYLMSKVSSLMNALSFYAVPLNTYLENLCVGQVVENNNKFKTKNVPTVDVVMQNKYHPRGDLQNDAHLYNDNGCLKRILTNYKHK